METLRVAVLVTTLSALCYGVPVSIDIDRESETEIPYAETEPPYFSTTESGERRWREALGYSECYKYRTSMQEQPRLLSDICAEIQCPRLADLDGIPHLGCGFGKRHMSAWTWVSTRESGGEAAARTLHEYHDGANAEGIKIPRTQPMIMTYSLDPEPPHRIRDTQLSYFLGGDYRYPSNGVPTPSNPAVRVDYWDDMVFYYRAFGGSPTPQKWAEAIANLLESVREAGYMAKVDMTKIMSVGFTSPGESQQRWEIWLRVRDES